MKKRERKLTLFPHLSLSLLSLAGVCLNGMKENNYGEEEETERRYRELTTMLIRQVGAILLSSSGVIFHHSFN